jgi:hypothetical protein
MSEQLTEKEQLEKEHSEKMNQEAVDKIKKDVMTQEESQRIDEVWFGKENEIKLLDGKVYQLSAAKLKDAKRLMTLLGSVSVDVVILNFIDTGNVEADTQRVDDFFEALSIVMSRYPNVDRAYLDEHCDLELARKILEFSIGLNGLKK